MNERDELIGILWDNAVADRVRAGKDLKLVPVVRAKAEAVADVILTSGFRKPRTITTAEDVAGMVVDSIVRTHGGVLLELWEGESDEREWRVTGHRPWTDAELVKNLPATVLHEPEATR